MPLPAIVPPLLTAAAGFLGGERQNALNRSEAARNRAFQSSEAVINRGFQERMRNTEWQAAVQDMTAAGINPAVAYARGGASAPGGSMPGGSQAAPATDSVGSALQAMTVKKNLELLDQTVQRTREETKRARFEARQSGIKADFDTARYMYFFGPDGTVKRPLLDMLDAEVSQSKANSARSLSEAELARFSVPERKAIADLFERAGGAGKGFQLLMPLLSTLIGRSR